MDGWPQDISERNDQSLMSTENINDDTQLKGFLSAGACYKTKSATVCASDMRENHCFVVQVVSVSRFPVVKQSQQ